ncbi:hypothetical protein POX_d04961 [Penicillium oxalicum]|uniref:hypothetical protein n=1 Tax=Penicillium oxalicum TaxID=69781 RepID=UPI0020B6B96B|nr:hypothetical protein POX_d04961 [Penicillium oxalicum]KAI2789470.1 hypothetical protein POX_d04961 [Penicillium oxalicum]
MSEGTLASAVAVPEQETIPQSPELPTKRRQSSISEHDPKRRRLSSQGDLSPDARRQQHSPGPSVPDRPTERRPNRQGREEDRKRGQRLFGGLLGTLSQSSTTAAQKRRADIEKRQQDKLKSQADEYDGLKKRRKERRDLIRKKETPFYEQEAMRTRHETLIAMAHSLKTRTEPVLYYKPWQLRPGDEAIIQEQIQEAEATIAREVAAFEAQYPPKAFLYEPIESIATETGPLESRVDEERPQEAHNQPPAAPSSEQASTDKPGADTKSDDHPSTVAAQSPAKEKPPTPAGSDSAPRSEATGAADAEEGNRSHHDDDGDEMLEDNEDTVIY